MPGLGGVWVRCWILTRVAAHHPVPSFGRRKAARGKLPWWTFRRPGTGGRRDPGLRASWRPLWVSGGVDLDGDGHLVGDDVVDG